MVASRPERTRGRAALGAAVTAALCAGVGAAGAQEAQPVLTGRAFIGDAGYGEGIVVLHHLSRGEPARLDSTIAAPDGGFRFFVEPLPDPDRGDVFFASVTHDGVLYFGEAITSPEQLGPEYRIQAFDTAVAPTQGFDLPVESRTLFLEQDSTEGGWQVTDVFQVLNDRQRTLVAAEGGEVWSHPLPEGAREVVVEQDGLAFDLASFEAGRLVMREALRPGSRVFLTSYSVPDIDLVIPNPAPTGRLDVLVREPAPEVTSETLDFIDRLEVEAGSTYRRFSASEVTATEVRLEEASGTGPPQTFWVAVVLFLILGGALAVVLRPVGPGAAAPTAENRRDLLVQVARLDEGFDAAAATEDEQRRYELARAELIARIRAGD